jgi:drug/metabolite transporter (DMT)-like permease
MSAVLLGVIAALAWGFYDFLIRFVSRGIGTLQAVLIVLIFGAASLAAAAFALGEPMTLGPDKFWAVAVSGLAYATALIGGYRAFGIGPVSLVAPLIATYPVFSIVWALANGSQPALADWLGVASIFAGVGLVARFAAEHPDEQTSKTTIQSRNMAVLYSGVACAGYAISFAAGQFAAQNASEICVTFFGRLWAIAVVLPMCLRAGARFTGAGAWLPILALMGSLDAMGLVAINSAGNFSGSEYAIVVGSCFGAVTVVLAIIFLKERLTLPQLCGMLFILAGVITLSSRY